MKSKITDKCFKGSVIFIARLFLVLEYVTPEDSTTLLLWGSFERRIGLVMFGRLAGVLLTLCVFLDNLMRQNKKEENEHQRARHSLWGEQKARNRRNLYLTGGKVPTEHTEIRVAQKEDRLKSTENQAEKENIKLVENSICCLAIVRARIRYYGPLACLALALSLVFILLNTFTKDGGWENAFFHSLRSIQDLRSWLIEINPKWWVAVSEFYLLKLNREIRVLRAWIQTISPTAVRLSLILRVRIGLIFRKLATIEKTFDEQNTARLRQKEEYGALVAKNAQRQQFLFTTVWKEREAEYEEELLTSEESKLSEPERAAGVAEEEQEPLEPKTESSRQAETDTAKNVIVSKKRFFFATSDRVLDLSGNGSYLVQFQTLDGTFESWLSFAFFLYTLGLFGRVINRKNFIVTRRAVERRYLGVITSFVLYGVATNDPRGAIYGLLLVILAACESAIGLGIILVLHRFGGTINFQDYEELGG